MPLRQGALWAQAHCRAIESLHAALALAWRCGGCAAIWVGLAASTEALAQGLAAPAPVAAGVPAVSAAPEASSPALVEVLAPSPASDARRAAQRSSIDLLADVDGAEEDDDAGVQPSETGLASWYGPGFHKRRTASGERFDMHALTAAHRTLPFGTLVCVRSQATGRGVVVRINDRGPHVANRVLDLSRGAALALGMGGLGLKPVDVFPLGSGEDTCPPKRTE